MREIALTITAFMFGGALGAGEGVAAVLLGMMHVGAVLFLPRV